MKRQLLINVALHALAIVLYGVLNDIAVDWYKGHYGGFTARGVSSGSIVFLVMWVFVPLNVVLPLLTNWKLKYWLVAVARAHGAGVFLQLPGGRPQPDGGADLAQAEA